MRLHRILVLILAGSSTALPGPQPPIPNPQLPTPVVHAADTGPGSWGAILSSVGLDPQSPAAARIFVTGASAPASPEWPVRVDYGAILILEGESPLAAQFDFHPGKSRVRVTSVSDVHRPDLQIIWEKPMDLPVFDLPAGAQVFAADRRTAAPLVAGMRRGPGAVLWLAAPPGERGYERFPYLLQALSDLGVEAPFRSSRLWAFFDSSYRLRVDLDYYAGRWRKAGISALHVAAWHFYEPDSERDRYLAHLIEACHRQGILVYAWLELPHVSEKFWTDHPEWREKTALLQDAQLDWRKLMNLTNRDCFRAVSAGVHQLAGRFDWDGINLAELYFESLQGIGNPSRFTPMNDDVRAEFRRATGHDPLELFESTSKTGQTTENDGLSHRFLEFRSELARHMQEEWIGEMESIRLEKPHLDLVLTHVDDRFDSGTRDAIGADAARVLPLLDRHTITFLIEDPATVWHLGAQRYHSIAESYLALTPHREKLAIDLNIVNRYQNVYPTRQQTGTELFQLVHSAAANFQRIALYFESSLLTPDLDLLPAASAATATLKRSGSQSVVDSAIGVGLPWKGPVLVDGQPWPVADDDTVWLPAGPHIVEGGPQRAGVRLVRLNAELRGARAVSATAIEFSYESTARTIAVLDRPPRRLEVDGVQETPQWAGPSTILLPRGRHTVTLAAD
jgi:hypothetical protein